VEDYLYAVDGMDVWRTIKGWVRSYYRPVLALNAAVAADGEL